MSEHGVKDSDFVSQYGMPEEFAGTPKVNDFMVNKAYEDNVSAEMQLNLDAGMDNKEATAKATSTAKKVRDEVMQNIAKISKARGY